MQKNQLYGNEVKAHPSKLKQVIQVEGVYPCKSTGFHCEVSMGVATLPNLKIACGHNQQIAINVQTIHAQCIALRHAHGGDGRRSMHLWRNDIFERKDNSERRKGNYRPYELILHRNRFRRLKNVRTTFCERAVDSRRKGAGA